MGTNLAYGIYIAAAKPFEIKSLNWQDLFNEFFLAASTYWKVLYSGLVLKPED